MAETTLAPMTLGGRLAQLAVERPAFTAITFVAETGTVREVLWLELEQWTNRLARLLAERGVGEDGTVVVELPSCPEHLAVTIAAWKLGAMAVPLNAKLPPAERDAILDVARATVVVADRDDPAVLRLIDLAAADGLPSDPLPKVVPHPGRAIASGGSTGRPKLIVDPTPAAYPVEAIAAMAGTWAGVGRDEVQLVSGPLYHNSPFSWAHIGLFLGHRLVVMDRFDAERAVRLIETYRVTFAPLVPTTMQRILRLPGIDTRDLSSVRSVFHTAAPCPAWVKRGWIDLVGAEHVYEVFGATESVGMCLIRGDEWLAHPGSVGRPAMDTELRILDDSGDEAPVGAVGEIYMRRGSGAGTYEYRGSAPARTTPDGFVSVGDLGWVDDNGYLYLADRRVDLIISGGSNIYPAEVELALAEHPGVCDSAVVGLPSEEWGQSVHAIVQPCDPAHPPTVEELGHHCRERLAAYKVPKSWELVDDLPRDEAGKLRRSALAAERTVTPAVTSSARPSPRSRRVVGALALVALIGVVLGGLALLGREGADESGPRLPNLGSNGGPAAGDPRAAGMDLSGEPSRGPRDADVVIVEFTDYQCEFCLRFHGETFHELLRANVGRVRYVVRHFPLIDVHPLAQKAAEAAECAHQQGGFWEYHDRLFAAEGRLGIEDLRQAARAVGLDARKFDSCLESDAMAAKVAEDTMAGQNLGVRGTPTFFVNGRMTEGAKPLEHFRSEIEQALAQP